MGIYPACSLQSENQFGPRINLSCRSFDFTLLFEDVIFAALPAALFLLILPSRIWLLQSTPSKSESYRLAVRKSSLLALLFIAQLLFLAFRSQIAVLRTKVSLPADTLQVVATAAAFYASFIEDQRSVQPSDILTLYFSASSILSVPRLRSLWLISSVIVCRALATIAFVLTVFTLVLECSTKAEFLRPQYRHITKEQAQSIWGRTFFIYTIPFFRAGFSNILSLDNVPDVDQELQGQIAGQKLRDAWVFTKGRHRLVKSTFVAYSCSFFSAVLSRLLLAVLTFAQPFLITATIQFMQHPATDDSKYYGGSLVGAFVLLYVGLAITTSIYWRQTYRFITVIRSGLISVIYDQTLLLQTRDLGDATAITLMGTDVERIVISLKNIHESWASILEVGVAIWLLERQVWVACVVPIVICLVSVFAMIPMSSRSGSAQKQWIERVQKRLSVTSSMLRDMKLVQMLGLSDVLEISVSELRKIEIGTSMRFRKLLIWQIAISNIPIDFAPFATFAVYSTISVFNGNETLLAAKAFTALALVSLLTNPLLKFCQAMPALFQAVACFRRIEGYLLMETSDSVVVSRSQHLLRSASPIGIELQSLQESCLSHNPLVSLENATVAKSRNGIAILHGVTLKISRGITIISGPVGSGKSTLLETLLGENVLLFGKANNLLRNVAYCSQLSWIQNATIRQNILGPLLYDEKWYEFTISACGLKSDLETIPGGDSSVTGSSGVALSGGQKQRIALARAVYSKLEVVVLDDTLSGLDSNTTIFVHDRLFGVSGHFREAGRSLIFATNSNSMYELSDNIIFMDQGRIVEQGPYDQIIKRSPEVASRFLSSTLGVALSEHMEGKQDVSIDVAQIEGRQSQSKVEEKIDLLRQTGSWSVYKYYAQKAGYFPIFLTFAFTSLECLCNTFGALWLQWWAEANERQPNQNLGLYIGIYGLIFALSTIGIFGGCWALIIKILNNTSLAMHLEILQAALKAPIVHFQRIDTGAITNRFSQDLELIDMALPSYAIQFISAAIICFIRLVVLCAIGKYLTAAVPFLLVILYLVQSFYLRTSRQVRLLDIEAKAPLYTHFTETIQGISSIRAFGWGSSFQSKSQDLLNQSQRPVYMLFCIQQWLTLVLDLVVGGIAVILIAIITTWKHRFSAVQVGVALNLLLSFNFTIAHAIKMWTMMEMSIGAVTRVQQFVNDTPSEDHESLSGMVVPNDWPSTGAIEFHNVVAGYSPHTPTLKDISLTLVPGTKTLICGPSGSGKTSLLLSLLHMLPISSGHITIDGIDTSILPPRFLRKAINVIPQDAFFMPGSLRMNLDPKRLASNDQIEEAVKKVGMWGKIQSAGGLDHDFDAEKWSVGEKQLLTLARAVLIKSKILVLDEAMSSVDQETETLMQRVVEDDFQAQTVLVVAHRLKFAQWCDGVVVIKEGRVVEKGSFGELVEGEGEFARLYSAGCA